jgi:WD40 repeat protein/serine/threonine protein kinase
MGEDSGERNPVEVLAEEYLERDRRGERPSVSEYVARYPGLAGQILELFPILLEIEEARQGAIERPGRNESLGQCPFKQLGDYRILREIGRGGMGVVYEVEQESLGRRVALKVLARAVSTPQHISRFEREARSAGRLHHTNIVPVFGVGCEGDVHYYVMQYIPGQPLDAVLKEVIRLRGAGRHHTASGLAALPAHHKEQPSAADIAVSLCHGGATSPKFDRGPADRLAPVGGTTRTLPGPCKSSQPQPATATSQGDGERSFAFHLGDRVGPVDSAPVSHSDALSGSSDLTGSGSRYARAVARIGLQVADAIEYAAEQGIIHRDVKPSNILLDIDGNAWVTDFGLAKVAGQEDLTHSGDVVGTLRYMAPERFRGESDRRSDVYSLGLTLHELLSLRPAYDEADRGRLIRRITEEDPPDLRKVDPSIPRDLATIVQKATGRDPAERYASAGALASDLRRYLEDRPIMARRPGALDRAAKWSRRNKTLVQVAGAMLFLLALGLAVATFLVWRANGALRSTLASEHYASYLQRIALAERESATNNLRRAEELLAECPENLRGWEWHYLKRQRGGSIPPLRHDASVYALAVSPAGDRLAVSDNKGGITIWDTQTRQKLSRFAAHEGVVWCLAFSPDGKRLASGGNQRDRRVKIWDPDTGTLIHELVGHNDSVYSVMVSPDGGRLFSYAGDATRTGGGEIRAWSTASGELLNAWPVEGTWQMAINPDGERLACAWGGSEVALFSTATGHEIRRLLGPGQPLWCVAFSPDGKSLAAGGGMHGRRDNGEVTVWDASTGRRKHSLYGHIEMVTGLAFSPDSRRLATGSFDQTVKIWDVGTGREVLNLRSHRNAVLSVTFGLDGRLYSGGDDRTVLVWDGRPWRDGESKQEFLTLTGHDETVTSLAYSPDGQLLASTDCAGQIRLWTLWTGREPRTLRTGAGAVYGVAFSPDGRLLAAVGDEGLAKVWVVSNGKVAHDLNLTEDANFMCVALSPDGRLLAAAGWGLESAVLIWELEAGRQFRLLKGHDVAPNAVAFQPSDGHYLVSGGEDGSVRVWDVSGGKELRLLGAPQVGRIKSVAFSADGKLFATGGWDRTVHLWDTSNRDPAGWKQLPHLTDPTGSIECVAVSPDGRHVAWGGTDSNVKVWDRASGETHVLRGHLSWVRTVAFSRDSRHIASGSQDGTVKIWPVPSPP